MTIAAFLLACTLLVFGLPVDPAHTLNRSPRHRQTLRQLFRAEDAGKGIVQASPVGRQLFSGEASSSKAPQSAPFRSLSDTSHHTSPSSSPGSSPGSSTQWFPPHRPSLAVVQGDRPVPPPGDNLFDLSGSHFTISRRHHLLQGKQLRRPALSSSAEETQLLGDVARHHKHRNPFAPSSSAHPPRKDHS